MGVTVALGILALLVLGVLACVVITEFYRQRNTRHAAALDEASDRIESQLEQQWRRYR